MSMTAGRIARRMNTRVLSHVSVAAILALASTPAFAVNGTWNATPVNDDFQTGPGNWSSAPFIPNETATFGSSTITTLRFSDGGGTVQSFVFNAGAPAYTFTIGNSVTQTFGNTLGVATGIVNNSSNAPTFNVSGGSLATQATLNFANATTAANAVINIGAFGTVNFTGTSTPFDGDVQSDECRRGAEFHRHRP